MKGARQYYNIIQKAHQYNVGSLRKLNLKYGWNGGDSEAYIYNNFVFVTSSHARGKCFHIYLIDQRYETDQEIKENAFEVYGITNGQPGWTEEYDWIHDGNWVQSIIKYLGNLQSQADTLDHEKMMSRGEQKKKERSVIENKLSKFNSLFV